MFFIKSKSGQSQKRKRISSNKYQKQKNKKVSKPKLVPNEAADKISSEEDDSDTGIVDKPSSDEDIETAQEKKLRLAKVYLEEIEKEELKRLENEEDLTESHNRDLVSQRLKQDYLKEVRRLKLSVADQYTGADISNIKVLKCKEHRSTLTCICISFDNNSIYSGSKDGSVVKWSLLDYKRIASLPFIKKTLSSTSKEVIGHSQHITCIAVSSDNKFLVVGDIGNNIQVWNTNDLKHMGTLKGHRATVTGVAFQQNTHTLYSCSKDKSVKIWSLDEMSYIETLYGHQDGITAISVLSRERPVTSGGRDCSLRIWKITEESQLIYNGHAGSIDIVRLINEENFISGGDDGQVCVWSSMKKKPLCTIKDAHDLDLVTAQPFWITSVAALVNTDLVASGSSNGFVKLWKLGEHFRSIDLLFTIEVSGFINDLIFSVDGKYLIAAVGREHRFGRWNVIKNAKNSIVIIPLLKAS